MFRIEDGAVIQADPRLVWQAWKPTYPVRPRQAESRNLDLYDLGGGLKVPVTLTAIKDMESWTVEHSLPRGRLVIEHAMTRVGGDRVRVKTTVDVHGPMSIVYRLALSRRIRKGIRDSYERLERNASAGRPKG